MADTDPGLFFSPSCQCNVLSNPKLSVQQPAIQPSPSAPDKSSAMEADQVPAGQVRRRMKGPAPPAAGVALMKLSVFIKKYDHTVPDMNCIF